MLAANPAGTKTNAPPINTFERIRAPPHTHRKRSPDVLPPAVMAELARVQDKIAPFSTAEARAVVERELGAPVDELFSEFGAEPVGAASLAQVYRAR